MNSKTSAGNHYQVFVIGGGINGAGIAKEAASAGYSVALCDSGDFGSGTSSASTKLIHGGLRYLEHYEFRLVREALMEREVLWKMAPHIIWPMRFVLPHHKGLRPKWLLRIGLFLYDNLGGRKLLPPTKTVNLKTGKLGEPLKSEYKTAFEYSDCWVEDSRLVILNLRAAQDLGADINPRMQVIKASHDGVKWTIKLHNKKTGKNHTITTDAIINAAGPWVDQVLGQVFGVNNASNVRLVRGSHIVIKKKFEHDRSYIFQNSDGRVIFAIPYEGKFTLIGTTDAEHPNMDEKPEITQSEIEYLSKQASEYFVEPVTQDDIQWTYSGVRPLYDDGASKAQEATRDYVLKQEPSIGNGSLINIFGGKITTYRQLALSVMEYVEDLLPKPSHTKTVKPHFVGGDFPVDGFDALVSKFQTAYPFIDGEVVQRLTRLYGTEVSTMLANCRKESELGQDFGNGLYQKEVEFLMAEEWAQTAQDVLFRRTKLGIVMSQDQIAELDGFMARHNSN
jgi:glycerol-3-phosphate dehydrogenase